MEEDFTLPSLAPSLKLTRAPDEKGEPVFTLHNPVANTYFRIDWPAFECLSRLSAYKTAGALKRAIESETTLTISLQQIGDVVTFLGQNALLSLRDQKMTGHTAAPTPLWKKIFHHYLYLSIPLFKPQAFLERTYPAIRWVYHPVFLRAMTGFLLLMIILTLPRADEFFHTFSSLWSAEGAVSTLIVLAFVKIVHEFAHAYTAIRYGVKVPHMGVAFIVMYPVLYTETTGSWALSSRRARFHIGMAGIMAELCLAAIFLALWHLSPSGSTLQSLSFIVVAVSLVSSLLVNLNPLMRFDGYYMFSDATGFDNLQFRACAFARHAVRRALFGWDDAPPEPLPAPDRKFLTAFGFALLIYRFFLFLGIAVLVYHVFFQPLGFILMMAELTWFIFLPIYAELKIWWQGRRRILSARRALIPAGALLMALLIVIVPWKTTVALPAVVHAAQHETLYPPSAARIVTLNVMEGARVEEGQVLATLDSPDLDFKIRSARQELDKLETLRRRGQSMVQTLQSNALSDVALEKARLKLEALQEQQDRLTIIAPFAGIVRDRGMDIAEGRYVGPLDPLFTLVDPAATSVTAFATESDREAIAAQGTAVFVSEFRAVRIDGLSLTRLADTGGNDISWPELSSVHGGPIAADRAPDGGLTGRRALYEITASADRPAPARVERGYLYVNRPPSSLFMSWINNLAALFRQEGNLG